MLVSSYINLNKLDKSVDVNEKGYLNLTIGVNAETDAYGNNASIWVNQTKEQREAGEPRKFIGNGKVVFVNPNIDYLVAERVEVVSNSGQNPQSKAVETEEKTADLPF